MDLSQLPNIETGAFRPRSEIARTPEKRESSSEQLRQSADPNPTFRALSHTHLSSLVDAFKPKTPSKLQNIVTFDSSSDSISFVSESISLEHDSYRSELEKLEMSPPENGVSSQGADAW